MGSISNNALEFHFTDTLIIAPNEVRTLQLMITIDSQSEADEFAFSLTSDGIKAFAANRGLSQPVVEVVSASGMDLSYQCQPTVIMESSFSGSVTSYPNPFDPRRGGARIGYYLEKDSDLEIRIFTLLGELVWSKYIRSDEQHGMAGLHTGDSAMIWDGKNDAGFEVRSGVYICVMKNITAGQEEKFKIAVAR